MCHLTYVNLPEKLAIHVLRHGLESQWGLVSPPDAAAIVCELIWRSTALSIDIGSTLFHFRIAHLIYAMNNLMPEGLSISLSLLDLLLSRLTLLPLPLYRLGVIKFWQAGRVD